LQSIESRPTIEMTWGKTPSNLAKKTASVFEVIKQIICRSFSCAWLSKHAEQFNGRGAKSAILINL
jgi:hypothetical protein